MLEFDHILESGNGVVVVNFDLDDVVIGLVIRPDKAH